MNNQQKEPPKMERVFGNILNTIIAAAVIWVATEVNKIDSTIAAMQERQKEIEEIRPAINEMHMSQEEIKERLIRLEDNQHRYNTSHP